jgi:mannose-1-phosphate guanylyltransferase
MVSSRLLLGFIHETGESIVYLDEDHSFGEAPKQFVVVQEKTILVQYTVEADGMIDAILHITNGNYDCVIDEDASHADTEKKGRIISVRVNDEEL